MQFQITTNRKSITFFKLLLGLFKRLKIISDYKIIKDKRSQYDNEVLNDISMFGDALKDAKNGLGYKTSNIVTIKDV